MTGFKGKILLKGKSEEKKGILLFEIFFAMQLGNFLGLDLGSSE